MPTGPMMDAMMPAVIAVRARTLANDRPTTTETAGAMNPASPSSRPLSRWKTL
jgi:hypothetical protein